MAIQLNIIGCDDVTREYILRPFTGEPIKNCASLEELFAKVIARCLFHKASGRSVHWSVIRSWRESLQMKILELISTRLSSSD